MPKQYVYVPSAPGSTEMQKGNLNNCMKQALNLVSDKSNIRFAAAFNEKAEKESLHDRASRSFSGTAYADVMDKDRRFSLYEVLPLCMAFLYQDEDHAMRCAGGCLEGYQPPEKCRNGFPYNLMPYKVWNIYDVLSWWCETAQTEYFLGNTKPLEGLAAEFRRFGFTFDDDYEDYIKKSIYKGAPYETLSDFIRKYVYAYSYIMVRELLERKEPDGDIVLPMISFYEAVESGGPISNWIIKTAFPKDASCFPAAIEEYEEYKNQSLAILRKDLAEDKFACYDIGSVSHFTRFMLHAASLESGLDSDGLLCALEVGRLHVSEESCAGELPTTNDPEDDMLRLFHMICGFSPVIMRRAYKERCEKGDKNGPNYQILRAVSQAYSVLYGLLAEYSDAVNEAEEARLYAARMEEAVSSAKKKGSEAAVEADRRKKRADAAISKDEKKSREIERLKARVKELESALTESEAALNKASKENASLKQEIESLNELFDAEEEYELDVAKGAAAVELPDEMVADKDIVVVGGRDSLVKRLKESFPDWTYIGIGKEQELNGKLSGGKVKLIVIAYEHVSHAITSICYNHKEKFGTPVAYTCGSNADKAASVIKNAWARAYSDDYGKVPGASSEPNY